MKTNSRLKKIKASLSECKGHDPRCVCGFLGLGKGIKDVTFELVELAEAYEYIASTLYDQGFCVSGKCVKSIEDKVADIIERKTL